MNIYRKKKHHIWTVVLNRNRLFYLCAVLLCFIFLIFASNVPDNIEKTVFTPMAKHSLKNEFDKSKVSEVLSYAVKPNAKTILKVSSPVFLPDPQHIPTQTDFENTKTPYKAEKLVQNPKTSMKTIASDNLEITNATPFTIDAVGLSETNVSYNVALNNSKVLIIHTHGCETYSSEDGSTPGSGGSYRTTDKSKNVTAVGKAFAEELKARGVSVIYDDTLCDYPSYNSSYKNSMALIEKYKAEHPDIRFVFDIHRDAIADNDGNAVALSSKIGEDLCAQVMIVCGTDASGLYHPNWKENLTLGLKIQKKLEGKYPGLARPLNLREERFNMHETTGSLIFEIGTHGNTLDEAKRSAVFLADAVCEVICN